MSPKILIQLDTDTAPSTFDAVVAVDSGVDQLFRHGGVTPDNVTPLVHGAMFTRGGAELASTALFVGGSDVAAAEAVFLRARGCFFGPVRVSVMLDANGCNTTAAAAVMSAAKHLDLSGAVVAVWAGTGPVGRRVAEMAALEGAEVWLVSRTQAKADAACEAVRERIGGIADAKVRGFQADGPESARQALAGAHVVIACGAAGVELIDAETLKSAPPSCRVAIDLNAVPPVGLGGIGVTDKAVERDGRIVYGAIGVGGLKMKVHRRAVAELFAANDRVLDAAEILALAKALVSA
ncbi:MAG: bifunctional NADP-dependent methylenetetrahydromethanopterin dehydrogenase/methylenetetrahydrofolate dehydrogenase [Planctomycetaceae bacterium]|nr:MAG: bifunctional NADP-dependent methylenetetrahydromethanopterin dehydrogenase/methylenetetrahydrofolate dehydrogenase [Planctomycetaceae bacterium]